MSQSRKRNREKKEEKYPQISDEDIKNLFDSIVIKNSNTLNFKNSGKKYITDMDKYDELYNLIYLNILHNYILSANEYIHFTKFVLKNIPVEIFDSYLPFLGEEPLSLFITTLINNVFKKFPEIKILLIIKSISLKYFL